MAEKKIRSFGTKKTPSQTRLKEFRNYVAQLKRKGILTGKIDPKVARPSFIRGGRKLGDIVNRHVDKLKPYTPRQSKVKPVPATTKSVPTPDSKIPINRPFSFRELPVRSRNLAGTLKELERNSRSLDRLKKPDEFFAFKIDGIKSYAVFEDMERLSHYLGTSAGIQNVMTRHDESQDLFESIKIYRWNKTATEWKPHAEKWSAEKLARVRATRKAKQAKKRRR